MNNHSIMIFILFLRSERRAKYDMYLTESIRIYKKRNHLEF